MSSRNTIAWIDHQEARIFQLEAGSSDESTIRAPHHDIHRHPKGPTAEHDHPDDLGHFFHDVAEALQGADSILLVGPSTSKLQFLRYVQKYVRSLEPKIVGVESADHPTDGQLVAHAKHYFGIPDRLK